jgi:hypothetical protein
MAAQEAHLLQIQLLPHTMHWHLGLLQIHQSILSEALRCLSSEHAGVFDAPACDYLITPHRC